MDAVPQPATRVLNGITAKAHRSDGSVLLAFDLDESLTPGLAGFAIQCTQPDGKSYFLSNRLGFNSNAAQQSNGSEAFAPSNQAPFQKFRWVYFPEEVMPGPYTYEIFAMYFDGSGGLKQGASAQVQVELTPIQSGPLQIGFTRGFLTSQAYASRFNNAPIEPDPKNIDYPTASYEAQYEWLGYSARKMVQDFLQECLSDPTITLDVFAYDLDEPDVIRAFAQLGPRLRAILDDAPLHTKPGAMEILAHQRLVQSAGADNVHTGHFDRFSHSKVLIQKKNNIPVKVLAGSANFSVRGLYVQANNVFVFNDPEMAAYYESAFQDAFSNMTGFKKTTVALQWFDLPATDCQPYSVCFSPHADCNLSLNKVASAVQNAQSSVLFAVMELSGGGDVMFDLINMGSRANIFSYGITQSSAGIHLYPPSQPNAILTTFAALDAQIPAPFKQEWRGGEGQVIHHKFIVVDFNGPNPVLFTGSSNLSSGGESDNGDNLIAIYDPQVVQAYAVEAVRLVDHYHFRALQSNATTPSQVALQGQVSTGQEWWRPYYDPTNIKYRDRTLFSK